MADAVLGIALAVVIAAVHVVLLVVLLVVYHAGLGYFNRGRFCPLLQSENG